MAQQQVVIKSLEVNYKRIEGISGATILGDGSVALIIDIPGLNYRLPLYGEAYERFPQGFILGSETASTVSSRGIYKFPVEEAKMKLYDDFQSSSYDLEACRWSNVPDEDFVWQDDFRELKLK